MTSNGPSAGDQSDRRNRCCAHTRSDVPQSAGLDRFGPGDELEECTVLMIARRRIGACQSKCYSIVGISCRNKPRKLRWKAVDRLDARLRGLSGFPSLPPESLRPTPRAILP